MREVRVEGKYSMGKTAGKGSESAIATGMAALLGVVLAKRLGLDEADRKSVV